MKLNLGCGKEKIRGYINIDNNPKVRPDVLHDLDNIPYPFGDNSIKEIYTSHTLEHVDNWIGMLNEMYRVSENNAVWTIKVPHFTRGYMSPLHKRGFSLKTFDFLKREEYMNIRVVVVSVRLLWDDYEISKKKKKWGRFMLLFIRAWNWVLNINPGVGERFLAYWFGGCGEIVWKIRVKK